MAFSPGDKVVRIGQPYTEYTVEVVSHNGDVKLKETGDWVWERHLERPYNPQIEGVWWPPTPTIKCECGSDSVGGLGHAHYCPKNNRH